PGQIVHFRVQLDGFEVLDKIAGADPGLPIDFTLHSKGPVTAKVVMSSLNSAMKSIDNASVLDCQNPPCPRKSYPVQAVAQLDKDGTVDSIRFETVTPA